MSQLTELMAAREKIKILRWKLDRAVYLADNLFSMVGPETWRAQGGDDGQGHYEGDYFAEKTLEEINELRKFVDSYE